MVECLNGRRSGLLPREARRSAESVPENGPQGARQYRRDRCQSRLRPSGPVQRLGPRGRARHVPPRPHRRGRGVRVRRGGRRAWPCRCCDRWTCCAWPGCAAARCRRLLRPRMAAPTLTERRLSDTEGPAVRCIGRVQQVVPRSHPGSPSCNDAAAVDTSRLSGVTVSKRTSTSRSNCASIGVPFPLDAHASSTVSVASSPARIDATPHSR